MTATPLTNTASRAAVVSTSTRGRTSDPPPRLDAGLPSWSLSTVEWLIGLLLVVGPFTFGAIEAWAQQLVLGLIALAAIVTLAGAWQSHGARFIWSWSYLPIALLLAIVGAQLVPVSAGVRSAIQPGAESLRTSIQHLAGLAPPGVTTTSLYALATQRQASLLVGGATLFLVAMHVYAGQPRRRRRLLRVITIVGLAMACLALGEYAFDAETILGLVARAHPYSGTFANHSHFGQFMNLSIGAAVALLIEELRTLRASGLTWVGVRSAVLGERRHWAVWTAALTVVLGPIAVLISLTRGGVLTLCAGAFVAALLLALTQPRRSRSKSRGRFGIGRSSGGDVPIFALLAGAAILLVVVAAGFNAAYDRVATLRNLQESSGGRLEIIRDALNVWRTSSWIGTGLGTHAYVFSAFDRTNSPDWASHAEDEYVQLLEETGAIGLAALLALIAMLIVAVVRATRHLRRAVRDKAPIVGRPDLIVPGLALGLVAVILHSASDFGQHMPAIAFLSTITAALLFTAAREGRAEPVEPLRRSIVGRLMLVIATLAVLALVVTIAPRLERDRRAESAFWQASIHRGLLDARGNWSIASNDYHELLVNATAAHDAAPHDVEYTFWLNAWRWEAIAEQADPTTGTLDAQLAGWTDQMIDELLGTARDCPTFGRPLAFAGQLITQLPLDDSHASTAWASALAARGAELAPYDAQASFTAGRLAATTGDRVRGRQLLERAAATGWPKVQVALAMARDVQDVEAARTLAGDDLDALDALADALAKEPSQSAAAQTVRADRDALIDRLAADRTTPSSMLDRLAQRFIATGERDRAIDCLSRAAATDYANVGRRMQLARLLADAGRYDDALAQAAIALRFTPGDTAITAQTDAWRRAKRDAAAGVTPR